jgi:hypothetical protein
MQQRTAKSFTYAALTEAYMSCCYGPIEPNILAIETELFQTLGSEIKHAILSHYKFMNATVCIVPTQKPDTAIFFNTSLIPEEVKERYKNKDLECCLTIES